MTEFTPPWERDNWLGDDELEQQIRHKIDNGRFSHGWMLAGASGIGKATLAYRIARAVLDHASLIDSSSLQISDTSQTSKLVTAKAHPDLFIAERRFDEKKGRYENEITVETIRKLTSFLNRTASLSKWRVAIIDKADELNRNAANALLKALEEPPKDTLILLVCDAPGRLIATIRSRCRRLDLRPLKASQISDFLVSENVTDDEDATAIASVAKGRPGYALELAAGEGGEAIAALDELCKAAFGNGTPAILIQTLTGKTGDQRWSIFKSLLLETITDTVRAVASEDETTSQFAAIPISQLTALSGDINALIAKGEGLNLDRAQLLHSIVRKTRAAYGNKAA